MEQIQKSGFYYANRFARIILKAYEEIMGEKGLNVVLNLAGLSDLIGNYPPDDSVCGFDIADFTAIHVALEELYGPRGGRGLALRAGRVTFDAALKNSDALAGFGEQKFKLLPFQAKMRLALPEAAKILSQVGDQYADFSETEDAFIWTIHRCPVCWGRKSVDKPVCYIFVGMLQAMLTWISAGQEFCVNETRCCAKGDTACEFVISKEPGS